MWNTAATKRITADGRRQVTITYVSDATPPETMTESFDAYPGMTDDDIAQRAAAGVDRIQATHDAFDGIATGDLSDAVAVIQATPEPVLVRTQPVVDIPAPPTPKETFATDYYQWQRMMRGVALGVIAADDATLAALKKSLVSAYLPEYLEIL